MLVFRCACLSNTGVNICPKFKLSSGQYGAFWNCLTCSTRKFKTVYQRDSICSKTVYQKLTILKLSVRKSETVCKKYKFMKLPIGSKKILKRLFIHPCSYICPADTVCDGFQLMFVSSFASSRCWVCLNVLASQLNQSIRTDIIAQKYSGVLPFLDTLLKLCSKHCIEFWNWCWWWGGFKGRGVASVLTSTLPPSSLSPLSAPPSRQRHRWTKSVSASFSILEGSEVAYLDLVALNWEKVCI